MGDIFDKACEEPVIGQECFSNALLKRAQTESLVALELEGLRQGREARFGFLRTS